LLLVLLLLLPHHCDTVFFDSNTQVVSVVQSSNRCWFKCRASSLYESRAEAYWPQALLPSHRALLLLLLPSCCYIVFQAEGQGQSSNQVREAYSLQDATSQFQALLRRVIEFKLLLPLPSTSSFGIIYSKRLLP